MSLMLVPARAARRRCVMAMVSVIARRNQLDSVSEAYLCEMARADLEIGSAANALAFARRAARQLASTPGEQS